MPRSPDSTREPLLTVGGLSLDYYNSTATRGKTSQIICITSRTLPSHQNWGLVQSFGLAKTRAYYRHHRESARLWTQIMCFRMIQPTPEDQHSWEGYNLVDVKLTLKGSDWTVVWVVLDLSAQWLFFFCNSHCFIEYLNESWMIITHAGFFLRYNRNLQNTVQFWMKVWVLTLGTICLRDAAPSACSHCPAAYVGISAHIEGVYCSVIAVCNRACDFVKAPNTTGHLTGRQAIITGRTRQKIHPVTFLVTEHVESRPGSESHSAVKHGW